MAHHRRIAHEWLRRSPGTSPSCHRATDQIDTQPQHLKLEAQSWLGRLANLNAARTAARGIAPHKPLMLLTVIDLIESGDIPDGWVKFDARLVSRFRDYWELVLERQRNPPDIPMPFHALGGERDRSWERFTEEGTPSRAKATTRLCRLDPELRALLEDPAFRQPPAVPRSAHASSTAQFKNQKSKINTHQSSIQRLSETASLHHSTSQETRSVGGEKIGPPNLGRGLVEESLEPAEGFGDSFRRAKVGYGVGD